jgi:hypothetical protein
VDEKIVQVQKDHPNAPGQIPFIKLEEILRYSQANRATAGLDCVSNVGSNHENDQSSELYVDVD